MKNTKTIRYKETVYTNFFPRWNQEIKNKLIVIIIIRNGISIPGRIFYHFRTMPLTQGRRNFKVLSRKAHRREQKERSGSSRREIAPLLASTCLSLWVHLACGISSFSLSLSLCPRNSFFHDRRPRWKLVQQTSDGKYSWRLKRWAIFFRWSILTRIRKGFFPDILADIRNRTRMVRA